MSGHSSLSTLDTSVRKMPLQQYAVPPSNIPVMTHAPTVPPLSTHRNTLRTSLRRAEVQVHEDIQNAASLPPKDRRRRTGRQMTTVAFNRDRFKTGLAKGHKSQQVRKPSLLTCVHGTPRGWLGGGREEEVICSHVCMAHRRPLCSHLCVANPPPSLPLAPNDVHSEAGGHGSESS